MVCVFLDLAVLVEHRLAIVGQTDRRTHDDGEYRASIASRGKTSYLPKLRFTWC